MASGSMMRSLASCRASSAAASAVVSSGYPIAIRSDMASSLLILASSCSAAEQLGLGGGEFGVGQDALLIQGGELVQLVNHRRGLWRGRCELIGLPPTTAARSNGRRRLNIGASLVVYCSCLAGATARPAGTGRGPP